MSECNHEWDYEHDCQPTHWGSYYEIERQCAGCGRKERVAVNGKHLTHLSDTLSSLEQLMLFELIKKIEKHEEDIYGED